MTQLDVSLLVPEVKIYKQSIDKPHVNNKSLLYKQRVFDWGLKTALLWIIVSGLFKQKPPYGT